MPVLALDLGGTKVAGALVDDDGLILERQTTLIEGRGGADVGALIRALIGALVDTATASDQGVEAVGVCVPGIVRRDTRTIWAPNIPDWDDYPLWQEIRNEVGPLPVVIDNDRACFVLGETWRGSAAGVRDAVVVAVGTGIGAGIMAEGRILRGRSDIAGSVGWLALDRPFQEGFVRHGCLEYQASGPGLVRFARDFIDAGAFPDAPLFASGMEAVTTEAIFDGARTGDPLAVAVLDNAIQLWGMMVANFVSVFNPEAIVFGGGLFGPAARYLDRIRKEATKWAQPIAMQEVRLAASSLGGDAGLLGAARLGQMVRAESSHQSPSP